MNQRIGIGAMVIVAILAVSTPLDTAIAKERRPPFSDAEYWVGVWEGDERKEWQNVPAVLDLLGIHEGEMVADLGAGTGYFTRALAVVVGAKGKVYAVDIEQSLLDFIAAREDLTQDRVVTVLAEPNDPKLAEGSVDLILTVNTWHHIKKRAAYLDRLNRALRADGRMVVIDFYLGDLPVGPPDKHKLGRQTVIEEFEEAGWKLVAESVALPYQYFLTFYPPRDPDQLKIFPDPAVTGP